jgi:hypothetical protein
MAMLLSREVLVGDRRRLVAERILASPVVKAFTWGLKK